VIPGVGSRLPIQVAVTGKRRSLKLSQSGGRTKGDGRRWMTSKRKGMLLGLLLFLKMCYGVDGGWRV
jgi:hypothetical protein